MHLTDAAFLSDQERLFQPDPSPLRVHDLIGYALGTLTAVDGAFLALATFHLG